MVMSGQRAGLWPALFTLSRRFAVTVRSIECKDRVFALLFQLHASLQHYL